MGLLPMMMLQLLLLLLQTVVALEQDCKRKKPEIGAVMVKEVVAAVMGVGADDDYWYGHEACMDCTWNGMMNGREPVYWLDA